VKNGWKIVRMDEVTTKIGSGATPKGGKNAYKDHGVPLIRSLNVHDNNFRMNNLAFLDDAQAKKLSNVVVIEGDVLLNITGASIARCCAAPLDILPARVNQHVAIIRPNTEVINTDFLALLLASNVCKKLLLETGEKAGATRQALTKVQLQEFQIPLPPLPEQQGIVAILNEAFEGIDAAVANAEKNLTNARELFESYLNNVFTQKGVGWIQKSLRDIAIDFGRGKSKHRPRNDPTLYDGPYPFIQTGDVRNCEHIIEVSTQTYNENGLAQSKLWPKGTICITIAANIAETGILRFDACFPDSIIGIVVDDAVTTNDFVEYLLQSLKSHIKQKGKGSAQDNINLATFENELFPFPPTLDEQKTIVETLNALSETTQRLEAISQQKLVALAELKQSILQKAFSGELTVHEAAA
jgi:type I restriction enzyme, S subunit